jgi:hypothetical protein
MMTRLAPLAAICGVLYFSGGASGAFVLLDNFEAYSPGLIAPQSGWWYSSSDYGSVAVDPADATNRVLVQGSTGDQYIRFYDGTELVPNGSTGTLFFRVYAPAGAHNGIGLSPKTNSTTWADGNPILRVGENASNQSFFGFDENVGTYQTLSTQTKSQAWYNVWMVADNATRTTAFYIQSDDDATFATQTQIGGQYDLKFRDEAGYGDLLSIFFRTANTGQGVLYFDDVHVDSTAENLSKPKLGGPFVAYREIFPYTGTVASSITGWNSRWGASASEVNRQEIANVDGSPTDVLWINSNPDAGWKTDKGYLVTHPGSGSYSAHPVLHWTEEYTVDRSRLDVLGVQWYQNNNLPTNSANDATRVALRIEDDWFVSEQTFSNTTAAWTLMELKDFGTANWLELDFDPGDSPGLGLLALGGPAPFLPRGNITGFGLFVDNATVTHRIDSFTILAIPEPGSALLLAVAALCVALGLPRRRRRG